jgi:DNA-binding CsgD family transcriptional regulator
MQASKVTMRMPAHDALREASRNRLPPITMTMLAAIFTSRPTSSHKIEFSFLNSNLVVSAGASIHLQLQSGTTQGPERARASRASPCFGKVVAMAADIRKSGIDVLGDLPWGEHFCLFYETKEDLLDAVVPYFKAGFDSNEFCVWAVSEPLTEAEAVTALRRAVPSFDRDLVDRGIEIIPGREWYLQGDIVDPKRITDGWHEKLSRALAAGYDGLRVSGNAFWLGTEHWQDFHDYEEGLHESVAGQPMIVLCTYPLAESCSSDILDVARAHQYTLARRRGAWQIIWSAAAGAGTRLLTPRELEVLTWAARGKRAWEIGVILGIGKRTVDEHIQTATRKLGAATRTEAVAIAVRERILTP